MATKSDMAKAVSKVTGKSVSDEHIFGTTLRAAQSKGDLTELPEYQAGQDFTPYGQKFSAQPKIFSKYLETLAVKYGLVFIKAGLAQNPLGNFKRGEIPFGGKIESVVFDIIEPKMYRPDLLDGKENPFATNFGRVAGETYVECQDIESRNTIVDTQDTMFFQNLTQFNTFIYGKISQLVNGAIVDEYYQTKNVLAKSLGNNLISTDNAKDVKELGKKVLKWGRMFRYFRRDSNALGFAQATRVEDIEVIMPLEYSVDMDVDFLMNAFNPELFKDTKIHITEVDEIPDVWQYSTEHTVVQDDFDQGFLSPRDWQLGDTVPKGAMAKPNATDAQQVLDGSKVGALVLDRDALQLWDQLPLTLSSINNPGKRYTNIFCSKKTNLMFVKGLNSKAILMDNYKPTPISE